MELKIFPFKKKRKKNYKELRKSEKEENNRTLERQTSRRPLNEKVSINIGWKFSFPIKTQVCTVDYYTCRTLLRSCVDLRMCVRACASSHEGSTSFNPVYVYVCTYERVYASVCIRVCVTER